MSSEFAQHIFMFDERLFTVFPLFELGVDLLDRITQGSIFNIVYQKLHDFVEWQLLPDEVGAHSNEGHDFRCWRLEFESHQTALDGEDAIAHLLEGFLNLDLGERLLLAGEWFFRTSLNFVDERRSCKNIYDLETLLSGQCIGFLSSLTPIPGLNYSLNGLAGY